MKTLLSLFGDGTVVTLEILAAIAVAAFSFILGGVWQAWKQTAHILVNTKRIEKIETELAAVLAIGIPEVVKVQIIGSTGIENGEDDTMQKLLELTKTAAHAEGMLQQKDADAIPMAMPDVVKVQIVEDESGT